MNLDGCVAGLAGQTEMFGRERQRAGASALDLAKLSFVTIRCLDGSAFDRLAGGYRDSGRKAEADLVAALRDEVLSTPRMPEGLDMLFGTVMFFSRNWRARGADPEPLRDVMAVAKSRIIGEARNAERSGTALSYGIAKKLREGCRMLDGLERGLALRTDGRGAERR